MKKLTILFTIILTIFCTTTLSTNANTQKQKHTETVIERQGNWTATYYGNQYRTIRRTANGDVFNMNAMTCAAPKKYKFGTRLKVTNIVNGKSVVVRVNDRGGFGSNVIDLTHGAFGKIANHSSGRIRVNVEVSD